MRMKYEAKVMELQGKHIQVLIDDMDSVSEVQQYLKKNIIPLLKDWYYISITDLNTFKKWQHRREIKTQ